MDKKYMIKYNNNNYLLIKRMLGSFICKETSKELASVYNTEIKARRAINVVKEECNMDGEFSIVNM